jgi:hypothetical protein
VPDSLKFQLELVDRMTAPGKQMEAQLKKLKLGLSDAEKQVRKTEAELAKLGKGKVVDIDQYRKLTAQLGQQKSVVSQLRGNVLGATDALKNQEAISDKSAKTMAALGGAMTAAAAAAGVLAIAVGAAAVAGMSLALSASEAKNDTLDALEAFQGSAEAADATYKSILGITDRVAISVKRGQELALELSAAGITSGDALTRAVESIGQVESVLGAGAGQKIQSIIEKAMAGGEFDLSTKNLKGTGVSTEMIAKQLGITPKQLEAQIKAGQISAEKGIDALTKAVNTKFGALAGKQVLDFGAQIQKAKDNLMGMFAGVDTSGFLTALKDVLSVFDSSTASGAALKEMLTSVFNGLFKVVEAVAPFVKAFLKGMIIIALQIYIAFKPLIKTIRDAFGGDNTASVEGFAGVFSRFGEFLAQYLPYVVQVAQAVVGFLIPAFQYLWAVLSPVLSIVGMLITAFASITVPIAEFFLGIVGKMAEFGANIVNGLVSGIVSMANAPVEAVKGIATSALNGFKSVFGIASPSKVMGEMGGHLMGGLEGGIDKNSSAPTAALADSVAPPQLGGSVGGGSKSVTLQVAPGAIVIQTSGGAQEIAETLPGLLANVFEQAMIEVGGSAKAA